MVYSNRNEKRCADGRFCVWVDELGRIVIPKEIRKNFRIREGDPLETTLEQLRIIADSLKMLALQV